ncbi:MAG: RsmG family class I SAM-dependent methyltransferase [Acidimicrobiia bacterium]
MFHGKQFDERLDRAAGWAGIRLGSSERQALGDFGRWLASEGIDAGGLGPLEASRIVDRHLADSLVFAGVWGVAPNRILDVGAGVGLPGIPLAITHPGAAFTLLDRSARRCHLARRAVRVLGLQNVSVEHRDVGLEARTWSAVLFRASLPPDRAIAVAAPLLDHGGCAVVALSRTSEPGAVPPAPPDTDLELVCTDPGVLDSPAWLLRMRKTEPQIKDGINS